MSLTSSPRRPTHAHRRAISLSSSPSGYVVFPTQARQRPSPHFQPIVRVNQAPVPSLSFPQPAMRTVRRVTHPHTQAQQHRPTPIRIASPPLAPIQESPKPRINEKLMMVTPSIAAYLRQGGSVSIRGPDGKAWKVRAPIRSPVCGVMMMRS
jgi:hypothetical protein